MAESEPMFAHTTFHVHSDKCCETLQKYVNVTFSITGLKEDYADEFNIPAERQLWKHNDAKLDDESSFNMNNLNDNVTIDVYQRTQVEDFGIKLVA